MRSLSHFLRHIQTELFPALEEVFGRLSPAEKRLVEILEVVQIERLLSVPHAGLVGRPLNDRRPIARAFVAKSVLGLTSTRSLLQALAGSPMLRRICGWSHLHDVPGESTFSRAFGEFADANLGQRIHESLVREIFDERLVGHVCRDSTAVEAPERPPARSVQDGRVSLPPLPAAP